MGALHERSQLVRSKIALCGEGVDDSGLQLPTPRLCPSGYSSSVQSFTSFSAFEFEDHGIKKDMFSCSQIKIYTTVAVIKETQL